MLVERAVRAWKHKYPCSKFDDCAVICLFFKRPRPMLTKTMSEVDQLSMSFPPHDGSNDNSPITAQTDDGLDTLLNYKINNEEGYEVAGGGNGRGSGEECQCRHRVKNRPIPSQNFN
ncbi:unnamed protein product [Cuscuta epithymum]|uniref:Uncharacterized protein n=1 Tax=Cuscuta epithymum TaxID=186058 RepID=A0AAV0F1M1_9ASTE|nr:unnamed protein product [Cuscuta epithymum]CAH9129249.1 unnamed protein product [Cuscuta epithymum]